MRFRSPPEAASRRCPEPKAPFFDITKYGAVAGRAGRRRIRRPSTTRSPRRRLPAAARSSSRQAISGPTRSGSRAVSACISPRAIRSSARPCTARAPGQDGGFYDAPEPNLFVGLQDHGHSHWANSLIYGVDVEDVMISGPGLIDGSYLNDRGETVNVLSGGDPREVTTRTDAGVPGGGNKAIALKNSRNIVFRDFSIRNGGHFAHHRHRRRRLDDRRRHRGHQPRRVQHRRVAERHGQELGVQLADRRRDRAEGVVRPRPVPADTERADRALHGQRLRRRLGHRQGLLDAEARRDRSRRADRAHQARDRRHDRLQHDHHPPRRSSIGRAASRSSPSTAPSCATSS